MKNIAVPKYILQYKMKIYEKYCSTKIINQAIE